MKTHFSDKPGPPESFRPTEIAESSVKLEWAEPNNTGGCDITDYHLEMKEANRTKWQKVSLIDEGSFWSRKRILVSELYGILSFPGSIKIDSILKRNRGPISLTKKYNGHK